MLEGESKCISPENVMKYICIFFFVYMRFEKARKKIVDVKNGQVRARIYGPFFWGGRGGLFLKVTNPNVSSFISLSVRMHGFEE